jgi:hypothetical protein
VDATQPVGRGQIDVNSAVCNKNGTLSRDTIRWCTGCNLVPFVNENAFEQPLKYGCFVSSSKLYSNKDIIWQGFVPEREIALVGLVLNLIYVVSIEASSLYCRRGRRNKRYRVSKVQAACPGCTRDVVVTIIAFKQSNQKVTLICSVPAVSEHFGRTNDRVHFV